MGGLSKKAFLIKKLLAEPGHNTLTVDSGNLLFATDSLAPNDREAATIAADTIIQATHMMGTNVAGLGTRDLAAGVDFLTKHQKNGNFSWMSLNLVDPATRKPLFAPVLLRQIGPLKVALLALTDHTAIHDQQKGFLLLPWQAILPEAVAKVQREADIIILLSNYSLAENQEIARNCNAIDLILQAGHAVGNLSPIVIDKTLISQVEIRGKYLGVMDIQWNGHGRWSENVGSQPSSISGQSSLTTFTNRFIPLKLSMNNEPAIETLVQQTQKRLETLQRGPAH